MAEAAVLSAIGLGIQGYGAYQSGKASSAAYKQEAAQAEKNAEAALMRANQDASIQAIQAKKVLAQGEVGFSAANLEGASALAVMMDSAINAEMDRLNIIYGGEIEAANQRANASIARQKADASETSGLFGLLAGGFGAAGKFAK